MTTFRKISFKKNPAGRMRAGVRPVGGGEKACELRVKSIE
jgi:hypothetical protein